MRGGGENKNDSEDNVVPPPLMGTAWELIDVLRRATGTIGAGSSPPRGSAVVGRG
jgi:hypothetical protein